MRNKSGTSTAKRRLFFKCDACGTLAESRHETTKAMGRLPSCANGCAGELSPVTFAEFKALQKKLAAAGPRLDENGADLDAQDPDAEGFDLNGVAYKYGRCDACGKPCDENGCTRDRGHEISNG